MIWKKCLKELWIKGENMKVLFATHNESKVNRFKDILKQFNIELESLKDYKVENDIDETGKDVIENAYLKAKGYYEQTHVMTISMDDGLYIEGIPEELQPGLFVRRVNGKELNNEEMIDYYSKLIHEYGGKQKAKWVYGIVVYSEKGYRTFSWERGRFYLVDTPCNEINNGSPLNSLSIDKDTGKYLAQMTNEEKHYNDNYSENDVIKFLVKAIGELK